MRQSQSDDGSRFRRLHLRRFLGASVTEELLRDFGYRPWKELSFTDHIQIMHEVKKLQKKSYPNELWWRESTWLFLKKHSVAIFLNDFEVSQKEMS